MRRRASHGLDSCKFGNAAIIFDWDDTLFPTSALRNGSLERSDISWRQMEVLVRGTLAKALELAPQATFIVTNGSYEWFNSSLQFIPAAKPLLDDVFIVSSRERYCVAHGIAPSAFSAEDNHKAKAWVFEELFRSPDYALNQRNSHVLSIGDANTDAIATRHLEQLLDDTSAVKFIKLLEDLPVEKFIDQLSSLLVSMEHILEQCVESNRTLTFDFAETRTDDGNEEHFAPTKMPFLIRNTFIDVEDQLELIRPKRSSSVPAAMRFPEIVFERDAVVDVRCTEAAATKYGEESDSDQSSGSDDDDELLGAFCDWPEDSSQRDRGKSAEVNFDPLKNSVGLHESSCLCGTPSTSASDGQPEDEAQVDLVVEGCLRGAGGDQSVLEIRQDISEVALRLKDPSVSQADLSVESCLDGALQELMFLESISGRWPSAETAVCGATAVCPRRRGTWRPTAQRTL